MSTRRNPRRWWALSALVASMLVLGFDLTILNVALPEMASQLGASTGEMQWIVDAYIVVFAAAMLPAGLVGDRFGRQRMLIAGLTVFLLASLLGALADTPGMVIAARTAMGLGAAFVMPLALSVLPSLFDPDERPKAVGAVTASAAVGMPLGPIIGGWLLDHFWWGSIFLVNVPFAAIAITVCLLLLPDTRDPASPKVDLLSTVFSVGGLGALVFGIIEGPERGWTSALVLGSWVLAATLISALVVRERRLPRPMLDLSILANRGFLWNAVAATLVMLVLSGLLFVLPQYLQAVLGYSAMETGVRLLPMMGGLLVAARAAGPLADRLGMRSVVSGGLVVLAFAAFLGSRTTVDDGYGTTLLWLSVTGFGFGFAMVPAMTAALDALPQDRAGSGTGLLTTLRQMGAALGVAILGSMLAGVFRGQLDTAGLPEQAAEAAGDSVVAAHAIAERLGLEPLAASADAAFVDGMSLVLVGCGTAALLAAVLAATLLPRRRPVSDGTGVGEDVRGAEDAEVAKAEVTETTVADDDASERE